MITNWEEIEETQEEILLDSPEMLAAGGGVAEAGEAVESDDEGSTLSRCLCTPLLLFRLSVGSILFVLMVYASSCPKPQVRSLAHS